MDKMEYPRNLIHFSTQHGEVQQLSKAQRLRKIFRPRVLLYGGLLILISAGLVMSLVNRLPFKVDVIRDRGVMARLLADGYVENVYRLQITNATESTQMYQIKVQGLDGLSILNNNTVKVYATRDQSVPISVRLPDGKVGPGVHAIQFQVEALVTKKRVVEPSIFYMPN
jgi:polyferredoxin